MATNKIRLHEIQIEGFRGINKRLTIPMSQPVTLLYASNGQGKTSLLGAIEWALFGEISYQERENGTNDELVNLQHPRGQARVSLVMRDDTAEYLVQRERVAGKRKTTLTVRMPDSAPVKEEEAEQALRRLTGDLTLQDFSRAVYLHQEGVRGLLTDDPATRDDALDRLFGLEKLRNLLMALPMKVVTDAVEDVNRKREKAASGLEAAQGQAEKDQIEYLKDATKVGFTEENLTLVHGKKIVETMNARLAALRETDHDAPDLSTVESDAELDKAATKTKATIKTIRFAISKGSPLDAATTQVAKLALVEQKIANAGIIVKSNAMALAAHIEANGEDGKLLAADQEITSQLAALARKRTLLGVKERLISAALEHLKQEPELSTCPVCSQAIMAPSLVRELEGSMRTDQATEAKLLETDTQLATKEQGRVRAETAERRRLHQESDKSKRAMETLLVETQVNFPTATNQETALEAVAAEKTKIMTKITGLSQAQQTLNATLDALDGDADKLRVLQRYLAAASRHEIVSVKTEGIEEDGTDLLQMELDGLAQLQESLTTISEVIAAVSKSMAAEALKQSGDKISSLYKTLCNHPYFDDLRIETYDKIVKGAARNSYIIRAFNSKDNQETLAQSRLSTGQMNCVALSIYLALADRLSHRLGFLILDDPGQNLDTEHKIALARVLNALRDGAQLLVATEDLELQETLNKHMDAKVTRRYRLTWTPADGTIATADT